jgi:hypothetical protein
MDNRHLSVTLFARSARRPTIACAAGRRGLKPGFAPVECPRNATLTLVRQHGQHHVGLARTDFAMPTISVLTMERWAYCFSLLDCNGKKYLM